MKIKEFDKLNYHLEQHLNLLGHFIEILSASEDGELTAAFYGLSLSSEKMHKLQRKLNKYVLETYKKRAARRENQSK